MDTKTYLELLRQARAQSRRADEAGDLLQTALLIAIEARRDDMSDSDNRRWLAGVLKNRARQDARSAVRRNIRETAFESLRHAPEATACDREIRRFVDTLPPGLKTTALLALTGHTRAEIGWLLDLPDTALRKRISDIRRRWRASGLDPLVIVGGPRGGLPFGLIRKALNGPVRATGIRFATHDPDGNLLAVSSQNGRPRQLGVFDT